MKSHVCTISSSGWHKNAWRQRENADAEVQLQGNFPVVEGNNNNSKQHLKHGFLLHRNLPQQIIIILFHICNGLIPKVQVLMLHPMFKASHFYNFHVYYCWRTKSSPAWCIFMFLISLRTRFHMTTPILYLIPPNQNLQSPCCQFTHSIRTIP